MHIKGIGKKRQVNGIPQFHQGYTARVNGLGRRIKNPGFENLKPGILTVGNSDEVKRGKNRIKGGDSLFHPVTYIGQFIVKGKVRNIPVNRHKDDQ
jgi:hypothetical protein